MENNNQPIVGGQPLGAPPKVHSKKLLWFGISSLGVLLVAGVIFFMWVHKSPTRKAATNNTSTAPSVKVAAPLVTTKAAAALGQGTYAVGPEKNILPGLYALSPGPQQSGTFTITSPTASYSVALNDSATGAGSDTRVAWAMLSDGDNVQISGASAINVNFRPAVLPSSLSPALAKLYDSNIIVTDTPNRVNPGKYFITDAGDQNAYILIVDKNYTVKYNQALNSTGFHAVLEDGDQIGTIHMTSMRMKPE